MCAWECGIRMGWVGKSTIQCWGMMWCGRDGMWRGAGVVGYVVY